MYEPKDNNLSKGGIAIFEKKNEQYFDEKRLDDAKTMEEKMIEELMKPLNMPIGEIPNVPPLRKRPANESLPLEKHVLWSTTESKSFRPRTDEGCIFNPNYPYDH